MKKILIALLIMPTLLFVGCTNYGKEKVFSGVELYYTKAITDAQEDAVGTYLIASKFADGNPKTVQLDKNGDTYQFRMVVKDGMDKDEQYNTMAKAFGAELSAKCFDGGQVEVHMCNDQLKTLKVIPMGTAADVGN